MFYSVSETLGIFASQSFFHWHPLTPTSAVNSTEFLIINIRCFLSVECVTPDQYTNGLLCYIGSGNQSCLKKAFVMALRSNGQIKLKLESSNHIYSVSNTGLANDGDKTKRRKYSLVKTPSARVFVYTLTERAAVYLYISWELCMSSLYTSC